MNLAAFFCSLINMRFFVIILFCLVFVPTVLAQSTFPDMPNVSKPSPEPAFPAGFDPFSPPVTSKTPYSGAATIAEWIRIAQPDATLAVTGSRFSYFTGTSAGQDTQFQVFSQNSTGSVQAPASILRLDGLKAAII